MAEIQLKVNPDELVNVAVDINKLINKIDTLYNILKRTTDASNGYWEGEASEVFRNYVKSIDDDMRSVVIRLKGHPLNIMKIAGAYTENETLILEQISTLPTDVIV